MGQALGLPANRVTENDAVIFVVPLQVNLSGRQLQQMIESGQQPGVPFCLGGNGVERPRGAKAVVGYTLNNVSVRSDTIKLVDEGMSNMTLSFIYDASVPSEMTIHLGGKDRSRGITMRLEGTIESVGPFPLQVGSGLVWMSSNENVSIRANNLPSRRKIPMPPDYYDIIIQITPSHFEINPNNVMKNRKSLESSKKNGYDGFQGGNEKESIQNESRATTSGLSSRSHDETSELSTLRESIDLNTSKLSLQQPMKGLKKSDVLSEITFFKFQNTGNVIVCAKPTTNGGFIPQMIPLRCEMKKIKTTKGFFILEEIYGLVRRKDISQPSHSSVQDETMKMKGSSASVEEFGISSAENETDENRKDSKDVHVHSNDNNPSEENKIAEFDDGDSTECVICLTDPRSIAVYPCRHMCMCISCANAMPAQNNKCPICRRAATLLLHVVDLDEKANNSS